MVGNESLTPSRMHMQVFEPRRFVELRKKTFVTQALSAESFGMGIFYTVNVFWIQFYLGASIPHAIRICPCCRIMPCHHLASHVPRQCTLSTILSCDRCAARDPSDVPLSMQQLMCAADALHPTP
jgi:hypothetical protein